MSKIEAISRYNLIVNRLRRSPATFVEINDYLERESQIQDYNFTVSKRTFQRDVEDILSLFRVDIQYNFSEGKYFIESDSQPDINNRMLEAYDTFNALNVAEGLSKYLHFEQRRPQGTENFYGLLHAIKSKNTVQFIYTKFWTDQPTQRIVHPYALKEFKSRWYLISLDTKDNRIKTFGLDRISNLEINRQKFESVSEFNIDSMFRHSFGILSSEGNPEKVILSFTPFQGKYIKSYPLHSSQKTIVDNHDEFRISIEVWLTYDLQMELLSYGPELKVISPVKFRNQMKKALESTLSIYSK